MPDELSSNERADLVQELADLDAGIPAIETQQKNVKDDKGAAALATNLASSKARRAVVKGKLGK